MRTHFVGPRFALLVPALLAMSTSASQVLERSTLDAGGGRSSGGSFVLQATIGQPDAGRSTGGNYQLSGGFWIEQAPAADGLFADGFE